MLFVCSDVTAAISLDYTLLVHVGVEACSLAILSKAMGDLAGLTETLAGCSCAALQGLH